MRFLYSTLIVIVLAFGQSHGQAIFQSGAFVKAHIDEGKLMVEQSFTVKVPVVTQVTQTYTVNTPDGPVTRTREVNVTTNRFETRTRTSMIEDYSVQTVSGTPIERDVFDRDLASRDTPVTILVLPVDYEISPDELKLLKGTALVVRRKQESPRRP